MKKIIAMLLVVSMVLAFAACGKKEAPATEAPVETEAVTEAPAVEEEAPAAAPAEAEGTVMTHADYIAAELDTPVCVETYVQGHQSWWDNKITVYAQSEDGAYFLYELECDEESAAKLVPGTKIRVNGFKSEWSGEVEIIDGTFEILEGSFVAEAADVTELLGKDELIDHQNEKVLFSDMTFVSLSYKNDEPGDDIYVTFAKDGANYDFCVEAYLTGPDTDLYKAVGELTEGATVDVEGFLYWYNGANPHITNVTVK